LYIFFIKTTTTTTTTAQFTWERRTLIGSFLHKLHLYIHDCFTQCSDNY